MVLPSRNDLAQQRKGQFTYDPKTGRRCDHLTDAVIPKGVAAAANVSPAQSASTFPSWAQQIGGAVQFKSKISKGSQAILARKAKRQRAQTGDKPMQTRDIQQAII